MSMRSVERDVRAMSLGLDVVNAEIAHLEKAKRTDRASKKRLSRLHEAKRHLIENPKESQKLIDRLN
tara:strand:+ start:225 stop:425 length:201 start_codon:yes stop_codon:yes gene_type:complete